MDELEIMSSMMGFSSVNRLMKTWLVWVENLMKQSNFYGITIKSKAFTEDQLRRSSRKKSFSQVFKKKKKEAIYLGHTYSN